MSPTFVQSIILMTTLCQLCVTQIVFDDVFPTEDAVRSEFDAQLSEIVSVQASQVGTTGEEETRFEDGTGSMTIAMVMVDNGSKCPVHDALTCCLTAVGLPCSQFNNNSYYLTVCGIRCGIPCIDDSSVDDDVGIVIESADTVTECFDEKPPVCCDYVDKNDLCSANITGMTTGCRKTCQQCS